MIEQYTAFSLLRLPFLPCFGAWLYPDERQTVPTQVSGKACFRCHDVAALSADWTCMFAFLAWAEI